MKKEKITEMIYTFLFTYVASLAMVCSVCDAFSITYKAGFLYMFVGVYVCSLTVALQNKKERQSWTVLKFAFLGEVVLFVMGRIKLADSLEYIRDTIQIQARAYLLEGRYADSVNVTEQTWGLLFLAILFASASAVGISICKKCWCMAGILTVTFLLPFFVGMVPKKMTLLLILVAVTGSVFGKRGGHEEAGRLGAAFLGIFIAIAAFGIGVPILEKPMESLLEGKETFEQRIEAFWTEWVRDGFWDNILPGDRATGGVSDGKLGEYSGLDRDTEVQLEVRGEEKPNGKLYIRGFVGDTYTGREWKRADERKFSFETGHVKIENKDANRKYTYHTYPEGEQIPREWTDEDSGYAKEVQKKYVGVPSNIAKSFSEVAEQEIVRTKPENVAIEIAGLLSDRASYSLNPGKTPGGKDFAEYFFFEKKEGYCTHFATTAVLLFRMEKIPARYIGGYVVDPSKFEKQKDGTYLAKVTGEEAHAWAEIYIPGRGWIPAETTPGYGSRNVIVDGDFPDEEENLPDETTDFTDSSEEPEMEDTSQTEEEDTPLSDRDLEPEEEDMKEEKQEEAGDSENGEIEGESSEDGKDTAQGMSSRKIIALIFLGFGMTLGIVFLLRKKRRKTLQERDYREQTKEIFYKIYKRLVAEKEVAKEAELDEEFVEKFRNRCPQLKREDVERLLDIIYRANYDRSEIQKEEYLFVRRILLLLEKRR